MPVVKDHPSSRPSFISLFSGCGGLDLGFIEAGFEPQAAYDIWPAAVENYRKNLGQHILRYDLSQGNIPYSGACDVVLAGSPCQGFSTVGKRNLDDPRNHLLHSAVRIAINLNPKVIVFENVPGILQGAHKKHWDLACEMLENAAYNIASLVVDGREIGISQTRKRVILLAWKDKINLDLSISSVKPKSLQEVIANASESENHKPKYLVKGTNDYLIASHIDQGQKLCNVRGAASSVHTWNIPEVFGATSDAEREVLEAIMKLRRRNRVRNFGDADPVQIKAIQKFLNRKVLRDTKKLTEKGYLRSIDDHIDLRHTFNGKFKRASLDGASHTVDSRFGDPQCFLHPTEPRGFSVREAARIQGFPDSYIFYGTLEDQFKLVANAVPPQMGLIIGQIIKKALARGIDND